MILKIQGYISRAEVNVIKIAFQNILQIHSEKKSFIDPPSN